MRLSAQNMHLSWIALLSSASTLTHAWRVTEYYQNSLYSGCSESSTDRFPVCFTITERVTPTGTEIPTGIPYSTTTRLAEPLTIVRVLVPTNAPVTYSTYDPEWTDTTSYVFETTIQPPQTCSSTYSSLRPITTTVGAYVPDGAELQVSVTSSSSSINTILSRRVTYHYKYIVPISEALPTWTSKYYCFEFTARASASASRTTTTTRSSSSSNSNNNNGLSDSDRILLFTPTQSKQGTAIVAGIIAVIVLVLFFLFAGIFEAFLNFRQIMIGHRHFKGGPPASWLLIIGIIPGIIYAVMRGGLKPARPKHEQDALLAAWDKLDAGDKAKLFFKHGFSSKVPPPVLAIVGHASLAGPTVYKPEAAPLMQQIPTPAPSYNNRYAPPLGGVSPNLEPQQTGNLSAVSSPSVHPQQVQAPPSEVQGSMPGRQPQYPPPPGPPPPHQTHGVQTYEPLD